MCSAAGKVGRKFNLLTMRFMCYTHTCEIFIHVYNLIYKYSGCMRAERICDACYSKAMRLNGPLGDAAAALLNWCQLKWNEWNLLPAYVRFKHIFNYHSGGNWLKLVDSIWLCCARAANFCREQPNLFSNHVMGLIYGLLITRTGV